MQPLRYELHCHSCVSPCGDDGMTPVMLCGMAKLAELDLLAVTDHNTAANLPAAEEACDAYGLLLLPGIEVTTEEEIHLLCYFPTVEAAQAMSTLLYEYLPDIPCDPDFFGNQLAMDSDDNIIDRPEKLLINAAALDLYRAKALAEQLGGLCIPAHLDKDSTSVLSVLGMMPEDLDFPCVEFRDPAKVQGFVDFGLLPPPKEVLTSSDAHRLEALGTAGGVLEHPEESFLWPLIKQRLERAEAQANG